MAGDAPSHEDLTPQELAAPFGILLQDTLRRTGRLEEALAGARERFSGRIEERSYRFFIDALELANEGARERIRELRQEFSYEDEARIGNYENLTALGDDLDEFLERYIPLLFRPQSDELQVFARPLTRVAKRLIPNIELLFFTWSIDGYKADSYDYGTLRAFEPLMAKNLRLAYGRDIKFVQLLHPMLREADPFHFAVFAHELGHVALSLSRNAWAYEVENDDVDEQQDLEEGDDVTEIDQPDPESLNHLEVVTSEVRMPADLEAKDQERLSDWFLESACDVFAMRLVGPVFALAYAEVTSANRPLEPEKRDEKRAHPPPRLRFKVLAEELAEFHLGQFESQLRPQLNAYIGTYLVGQDDDGLSAVAEPWLAKALDRLRELLQGPDGILKDQEYKPEHLRRDLGPIFELADRRVPPAERLHVFEDPSILGEYEARRGQGAEVELAWSDPFDWRSILNGMLLWHLREFGAPPADLGTDLAAAKPRATHRARAARLALGGVELSEFQTRAVGLRREVQAMRPVERETKDL